jgi:hypothetical protein
LGNGKSFCLSRLFRRSKKLELTKARQTEVKLYPQSSCIRSHRLTEPLPRSTAAQQRGGARQIMSQKKMKLNDWLQVAYY